MMPMKRAMAIVLHLLFLVIPTSGEAQKQSSSYTKEEVDVRINELRSLYNTQFVPRSEIDARFNKLQSLIERNEMRTEQQVESIRQSLGALRSDITQLIDRNEQIAQQRVQGITEKLTDFARSNALSSFLGPDS